MTIFDPDPRLRWLFCMTHPDDEISICAWIKRLVLAGAEVHMSWTHSNPTREAEARAASLLLGVPQSNLHFFDATDGSAMREIPDVIEPFSQMVRTIAPDRVCCGAFEQGHLDHDATNFLVSRCYAGPILEIPFYHTYLTRFQILNRFATPAGQQIIHLTMDERRLKTHVARQFPSQNIWTVLMWYELWQKARLRPMELTRTERMRVQTHFDYLKPNLPPRLAGRVVRSATWRKWVETIAPLAERFPLASDRERVLVQV